MKIQRILTAALVMLLVISLAAVPASAKIKKDKKEKDAYRFKVTTEVKRTPIKSQARTGTCWCFATLAFLESELLRTGKGEFDLSEMFVVRKLYPEKVVNYVRLHGSANHSQGGQSHDALNMIRRFGIVPEEVYDGLKIGEKRHNHGELSSVLSGMVAGVLKKRGKRLTPRWLEAYNAVLDIYLGKPPEEFTYKGQTYTPKSFAQSLGLDMNDYIEITSYSHHPFYKKCRLEIPDNWDYNSDYYNVPLNDLERIAEHSLTNGYSMVFDGDCSEKGFKSKEGYAVVPEIDWDDKTKAQQEAELTEPEKEKVITQELRQKTFDDFTTTDDHLMHMVGIAKDQKGTRYYLIKNSWGTDRKYDGYLYMSNAFFRLKTTVLTVHKDALPEDIKKKLGL